MLKSMSVIHVTVFRSLTLFLLSLLIGFCGLCGALFSFLGVVSLHTIVVLFSMGVQRW